MQNSAPRIGRRKDSSGTHPPGQGALTSQLATCSREAFRMSLSKGTSSPFLTLTMSSRENKWSASVKCPGSCSNSFNVLPERKPRGNQKLTHTGRGRNQGLGRRVCFLLALKTEIFQLNLKKKKPQEQVNLTPYFTFCKFCLEAGKLKFRK